MATVTVATGPEARAAVGVLRALRPGRSFALRGVSWADYEHLCEVRDAEAVREVNRRAGIPIRRVVHAEVIER